MNSSALSISSKPFWKEWNILIDPSHEWVYQIAFLNGKKSPVSQEHCMYEFEQAPEVGDRQGSWACCSPWGCKELHTTERLNWWIPSGLGTRHVPSGSINWFSVKTEAGLQSFLRRILNSGQHFYMVNKIFWWGGNVEFSGRHCFSFFYSSRHKYSIARVSPPPIIEWNEIC